MPKPKYPRARLSPAKDQLLVIRIARESVATNDVRPLLDKLARLSATRAEALRWEGKLTFAFDGWDDDPRETAEIPEIRAYFLDVTAEWPFWFHYCEKVGDTVLHVLRLLCRGHREQVRAGMVGWQFDDPGELSRQMLLLFSYMNVLYDRFDLSDDMNQRITEEGRSHPTVRVLAGVISPGGVLSPLQRTPHQNLKGCSRGGIRSGSMQSSIALATPGVRRMNPRCSSRISMELTDGGVRLKNRCRSA